MINQSRAAPPGQPQFLIARQNWAAALTAYRRSVDLYRQVLQSRVDKDAHMHAGTRSAGQTSEVEHARRRADRVAPAGQPDLLSAREREVAELLALGYSNSQIADALVITRGTVANHVAHILTKLGLANRTQVAAWMIVTRQRNPHAQPPEWGRLRDA
jgi:DNA-binding NarL/FixJ family response regulator